MREGGIIAGIHQRRAKDTQSKFSRARLSRARTRVRIALTTCFVALMLALTGCSNDTGTPSASGNPSGGSDQTSGAAFERPELALSPFDETAADTANGASIDASHLAEGYVAASATSTNRLKFQVTSATTDLAYNYDLPNDGTPISCPLNMGDGTYTFTVWENTTGNRYVELTSLADQQVVLADEFQPFIRPSAYCDYAADSTSTTLANELCANAQNQGDVVCAIYDWIVSNITYNEDKATSLADATGYSPLPDATIESRDGICFDYASLAAAMLRSQGIPCKIVTGNVSPDDIYHAWNMVYIDGTWVSAGINVQQSTWTRIDTTFAAGSGSNFVGDGTNYTDQYTY